MPSHDLYITQILTVVNNCRYSNHFVEYVDCNYIQFISAQTNNLITPTVISAFVSDKTNRASNKNAIDNRSLLSFTAKNLVVRQKAREFPKVRHLMIHGYHIDLMNLNLPSS